MLVNKIEFRRGDIVWVDLGKEGKGSEQNGVRPCVILMNDIGCKYSPVLIVAVITSQSSKAKLPTHVEIGADCGLLKESIILLEQLRTISKERITGYIGKLSKLKTIEVNQALAVSVELAEIQPKTVNIAELKMIKKKVEELKSVDQLIISWIDKRKEQQLIEEVLNERKEIFNELKSLCEKNNLKVEKFYEWNCGGNHDETREYKIM